MKDSEIFTLNHFLSDYPDDKSFDEILVLINNGSEVVKISSKFVFSDPIDAVTNMLDMALDIEKYFFPLHELVTVIDKETVSSVLESIFKRKAKQNEIDKVSNFLDEHFSHHLKTTIEIALPLLKIKANT